jgi:hypothetical protein
MLEELLGLYSWLYEAGYARCKASYTSYKAPFSSPVHASDVSLQATFHYTYFFLVETAFFTVKVSRCPLASSMLH